MTLIAISRILQSDHTAKIYMIDYGTHKPYEFICDVHFLNIPYYRMNALCKRLSIKDFLKRLLDFTRCLVMGNHREFITRNRAISIIKSIDYLIDISGYQLGSKWGEATALNYCDWINVVAHYGGKVFLMPQSFGPFDFSDATLEYIKESLAKCCTIYARETKGYNALVNMGLKNVTKSEDSVLIEHGFDASMVIRNYENYCEEIEADGKTNICIVPNCRLVDFGGYSRKKLLDFYARIINHYKKAYFYLVAHASEDIALCREIKEQFNNDERVVFIDHVLLSFNYESLAKKMNFIIASRYHSIIHAYKKYTPAVILGWAEKYEELAVTLSQGKYLIALDNIEDDLNIIDLMFNSCEQERILLSKLIPDLQKKECYSFLGQINANS